MSSNAVVEVNNISKVYKIYNKPIDRLKQLLFSVKNYREFEALKNISLKINKGETVGIIGRNGSGKSTLLQIIAGTLSQTSGDAIVKGRIAALLELGSGFNPEFTGRENVYINGAILGLSREEIDKRFDSIEKFADIGDFIDQPVKTYSSGMYVRLAFAVSINVDADILIIDEALAVGDVFFQAKCYKKFEEFKKQGKTIIFVSHDLSSIIKYCDRSILLHKGQLICEGTSKEVVDEYKKLLVNLNTDKNIKKETKMLEPNDTLKKWSDYYKWNPEYLDYGNSEVNIVDFGVFNESNELTTSFGKNQESYIRLKLKFNNTVHSPIFAFTFKDIKGTEIAGTNTMIEEINTGVYQNGDTIVVEFSQKLNLQPGNYLLSLGCTGFKNEEFVVYHRLYDIINIQIIAPKVTLGYVDLDSKVSIKSNHKVIT